MYPNMGGGDMDMWHDRMYICKLYISCNIVVTLVTHLQ